MRAPLIGLALGLTLTAPLTAQRPAGALLPGDTALLATRLHEETVTYRWLMIREGAERPVGEVTDELRRVDWRGTPALLRVQTVRRGGGLLVDSTLSRASDLAPLQHRSHQPTRTVQLDFRGGAVRGAVTPLQGDARQIDTTYAVPFFDSGNWDLMLRALTLRAGREVALPVYDPDNGGQIWYSARVVGSEPDGSGGSWWRIDADLGQGAATLWLDPDTRSICKVEMRMGPGVVLRQVRA